MIKVYSTTWCPFCKSVKAYFNEKKIKYEDIDVEKDEKAQQEMVEKSGQMGIPVIDMNGEIIIGFDKEKIDAILRKIKK